MHRVKRTLSACAVVGAVWAAAGGGEAITAVERFIVPQAMAATTVSHVLPGRFEAEDFDKGGEGVGYHDKTSGNAGGHYRRNEDVDIIKSRDSGEKGGYVVNNFETGEWLAYTVEVDLCGDYEFALRAASRFGDSAFRIEVDGRDVTGRVAIPDTGGWGNYQWITAPAINLSAGRHQVKIISEKQYFDFNAVRATAVGVSTGGEPYTLHVLPGELEAEDFDMGGEGRGYHDNRSGNSGGHYRTGEDVDIVLTKDGAGGQYEVNNFQTGEWLAYTVEADHCGDYEFALRASSRHTDSKFRILVDGQDVTGPVSVPDTGSWGTYQWIEAPSITLSAGLHVVKVVADQQYFNLNKVRASIAGEEPVAGIPVPSEFEAEDFNLGGEGVGYHDSTAGNQGDAQYRTDEDVDIFLSNDPSGGGYVVKNFESGEWLAYTIEVAQTGEYNVELRGATSADFPNSTYHVEVDGVDATGAVTLPDTGGWNSYKWVGKTTIQLTAGAHDLRIVSDQPYFALNSVKVTEVPEPEPEPGIPVPSRIEAEDFDFGGESVAYHDTTPGNAGGEYRPYEDVDLFVSNDSSGGGYIVKNFDAGEWLAYTIEVAQTGDYDVELRAATSADFPNSTYHVEVDGVDATGAITLPDTGGWNSYQWVGKTTVPLTAGAHDLTIVSDQAYFALNSVRVTESPEPQPLPGIPVPSQFEAEDFDLGDEGAGYHDSTPGNAGGEYRPDEDVDLFVSNDSLGGGYIVKNFEVGEWLAYTIEVGQAGSYDIELRAATSFDFPDSAFHVEVGGIDATGTVSLPDTGGWNNYQWVGKSTLSLAAGTHILKVVADRPYFALNSVRVMAEGELPPPPPPPSGEDTGQTTFYCSFDNTPTDCGFRQHAADPSRATIVNIARDGSTSVRLRTEPGDTGVAGAGGQMERSDLWLTANDTGCPKYGECEGIEQWWAHSIYLPSDFQAPTWHNYVLFDFHNTTAGDWQANFHVAFKRQSDTSKPGRIALIGHGGQTNAANTFEAIIGLPVLNQWYDFVYHVRWSSGSDGFFDAWVNGEQVLSHRGPTLYTDQGVNLKLANYHVPICDPYPACIGTHEASSVIHDRVRRGTSALSVARGPLEGELELVDGELVPVSP